MIEADGTGHIVVIGDLHLDPDPQGDGLQAGGEADVALRDLADALATTVDGGAGAHHLVLLGDVVDFDRVRRVGAAEAAAQSAIEELDAKHTAPLVVLAHSQVAELSALP